MVNIKQKIKQKLKCGKNQMVTVITQLASAREVDAECCVAQSLGVSRIQHKAAP